MFAEVHPSDQAMGSFAASVWHNFRTRPTVTAQGTAVRGDKPPRMWGGGGVRYTKVELKTMTVGRVGFIVRFACVCVCVRAHRVHMCVRVCLMRFERTSGPEGRRALHGCGGR